MVLLLILMIFSLGAGGWGYSRWGWKGMSPAGVVLLVLFILYLTGGLHLG